VSDESRTVPSWFMLLIGSIVAIAIMYAIFTGMLDNVIAI